MLLNGNISGWTWEEIYSRLLSVQYRNDTDTKVLIKISGRMLDILVLTGGNIPQSSPPNNVKVYWKTYSDINVDPVQGGDSMKGAHILETIFIPSSKQRTAH